MINFDAYFILIPAHTILELGGVDFSRNLWRKTSSKQYVFDMVSNCLRIGVRPSGAHSQWARYKFLAIY